MKKTRKKLVRKLVEKLYDKGEILTAWSFDSIVMELAEYVELGDGSYGTTDLYLHVVRIKNNNNN